MAFPDEPKGADAPSSETAHTPEVSGQVLTEDHLTGKHSGQPPLAEPHSYSDAWSSSGHPGNAISLTPTAPPVESPRAPVTEPASQRKEGGILSGLLGGFGGPPKPPGSSDDEDEEEDGMARMSFLE